MAELDTKKREKLRSSQFADVDSEGGEHQERSTGRTQGLKATD
jgi:hypothetical protein